MKIQANVVAQMCVVQFKETIKSKLLHLMSLAIY